MTHDKIPTTAHLRCQHLARSMRMGFDRVPQQDRDTITELLREGLFSPLQSSQASFSEKQIAVISAKIKDNPKALEPITIDMDDPADMLIAYFQSTIWAQKKIRPLPATQHDRETAQYWSEKYGVSTVVTMIDIVGERGVTDDTYYSGGSPRDQKAIRRLYLASFSGLFPTKTAIASHYRGALVDQIVASRHPDDPFAQIEERANVVRQLQTEGVNGFTTLVKELREKGVKTVVLDLADSVIKALAHGFNTVIYRMKTAAFAVAKKVKNIKYNPQKENRPQPPTVTIGSLDAAEIAAKKNEEKFSAEFEKIKKEEEIEAQRAAEKKVAEERAKKEAAEMSAAIDRRYGNQWDQRPDAARRYREAIKNNVSHTDALKLI